LDRDLAALYGVDAKVLKQAVIRNIKRFPSDFMFELTKEEFENHVNLSRLPRQNDSAEQTWIFCLFFGA
jgi:hypothetical protein